MNHITQSVFFKQILLRTLHSEKHKTLYDKLLRHNYDICIDFVFIRIVLAIRIATFI